MPAGRRLPVLGESRGYLVTGESRPGIPARKFNHRRTAMQRILPWGVVFVVVSLLQVSSAQSQPVNQPQTQTVSAENSDSVPRLIRFNGTARDASGTPIRGSVAVTFALYDAQSGGQLLWSEKQSVQCDEQGHYTVLLGSTQQEGLPLEV